MLNPIETTFHLKCISSTGIESLFNKINCDRSILDEMLGSSSGIRDNNVMQYLGLIEQRTNELLSIQSYLLSKVSLHHFLNSQSLLCGLLWAVCRQLHGNTDPTRYFLCITNAGLICAIQWETMSKYIIWTPEENKGMCKVDFILCNGFSCRSLLLGGTCWVQIGC